MGAITWPIDFKRQSTAPRPSSCIHSVRCGIATPEAVLLGNFYVTALLLRWMN